MKKQIYKIINFNEDGMLSSVGRGRAFYVTDELLVAEYLSQENYRAFMFPQNIEIESFDLKLNQGKPDETT